MRNKDKQVIARLALDVLKQICATRAELNQRKRTGKPLTPDQERYLDNLEEQSRAKQ